MATQEKFVPTHRFNGTDKLVFWFNQGDEVIRLRDHEGIEANGVYQNAYGNVQIVDDSAMEPIVAAEPAPTEDNDKEQN